MANEDPKVVPGNLKVPPLKIVLSSHQNSVSVDEEPHVVFKTSGDKTKDSITEERSSSSSSTSGRRAGAAGSESHPDQREKHHKRASKSNSESLDDSSAATRPTRFLSASSSSSSSDRSSSTTPSSESESLASNSTIISDHNQEKGKSGTTATSKDDSDEVASISVQKLDRSSFSRHGAASSSRSSNIHKSNSSSTPTKRAHDQEQSYEQHTPSNSTGTRDLTSNSNQRITRSSQRAAQQTKASETTADSNGDESLPNESHEKIPDSSRKVKRRKGEVQDNEHDTQSTTQTAPAMANICPADYLLPSQNSFELYRDIRKQPYKKLMKLSHIQPKIPLGFKDYLINGGPYLLEGNKLGTGIGGHRIENLNNGHAQSTTTSNRAPLKAKLSNHKNGSIKSLLQRHSFYAIPKPLEVPKSLQAGTPLHDLFQEQEKARQQMRMQHLKERERAILAAEQEILRAYNNAAIADVRQKRHLSACTFFYYQERYHYLNEGTRVNSSHQLEGDNSSLINDNQDEESNNDLVKNKDSDNIASNTVGHQTDTQAMTKEKVTSEPRGVISVKTQSDKNDAMEKSEEDSSSKKETSPDTNGSIINSSEDALDVKSGQRRSSKDTERNSEKNDGVALESKNIDQAEAPELRLDESSHRSPLNQDSSVSKNISDEDLKLLNKEIFITQLHQIDDKWDYIKRDMMVRHKNEADSLNAVQSLDWEWKAKEIGVCDVRVTLKVEPEFVPKVEVEAHNY